MSFLILLRRFVDVSTSETVLEVAMIVESNCTGFRFFVATFAWDAPVITVVGASKVSDE